MRVFKSSAKLLQVELPVKKKDREVVWRFDFDFISHKELDELREVAGLRVSLRFLLEVVSVVEALALEVFHGIVATLVYLLQALHAVIKVSRVLLLNVDLLSAVLR